jgi:hypothetical protein
VKSAATTARDARELSRLAALAAASRQPREPVVFGSDYSRHPIPGQLSLFAGNVGRKG